MDESLPQRREGTRAIPGKDNPGKGWETREMAQHLRSPQKPVWYSREGGEGLRQAGAGGEVKEPVVEPPTPIFLCECFINIAKRCLGHTALCKNAAAWGWGRD